MEKSSNKINKRTRRHARIRAKIKGTEARPRLCVFRSNTAIYAQLVNDEKGITIASSDSRKAEGKNARERAQGVGNTIASLAKKAGVEKVVFDRGGFLFTGVIKEVAEGARKGGLIF